MNDKNYKGIVKKLHDYGWKNGYLNYANVNMLVRGCCVPKYPQCYDKQLEKYELAPHPSFGSFEGDNGEKRQKK